jgi:hypothetical protein
MRINTQFRYLFATLLCSPIGLFAGTVTLKYSPLSNPPDLTSFSNSNFNVCGSAHGTFEISYSFTTHSSCWSDRYKYTFKLYRNGALILSTPQYLTSTTTHTYIFGMGGALTVTPGSYTGEAILERRPCIGAWYTAETASSNSMVASSIATPNFSINGIAATDPASGNIPSIVCNAGAIVMNASSATCESAYWVGVWETTHNWWERTFDYEWGGWFQGQAPNNISLQNLATTSSSRWINGPANRKDNILMGGLITNATTAAFIGQERYYTIEFCTGEPTWTCKKMQIKVAW